MIDVDLSFLMITGKWVGVIAKSTDVDAVVLEDLIGLLSVGLGESISVNMGHASVSAI